MDGFYDRRSCLAPTGNPSSWAGYTGQDFLPQHAVNVSARVLCVPESPSRKAYYCRDGEGGLRLSDPIPHHAMVLQELSCRVGVLCSCDAHGM